MEPVYYNDPDDLQDEGYSDFDEQSDFDEEVFNDEDSDKEYSDDQDDEEYFFRPLEDY